MLGTKTLAQPARAGRRKASGLDGGRLLVNTFGVGRLPPETTRFHPDAAGDDRIRWKLSPLPRGP